MQPFILNLQEALGGKLGWYAGLILLTVVLLQISLMVLGSLGRVRADRRQRQAALERVRLQIQEAKLRCADAAQIKLLWNGFRKFTVAKKNEECRDVYAFYLKPHDGKALPSFKPGQYLTFQLDIPGRDRPVVRCYSLSDSPTRSDYYRVTIKKEPAPRDRPELPAGVASSFFSDTIREGDILSVKAPTGGFFLDMEKGNPVVLIAGGVGVTPMLSMANAIAARGSKRETWFFYGVRSTEEHMHKAEIEKLAAENDNIHLHVCYSRPGPGDVKGRDYQHEGRVTSDLIKELLPSSSYKYYLCGNGAFMKSITDGLEAWGVPESDVFFEAFGPATVKKKTAVPATAVEAGGLAHRITFSKTGKTATWNPALLSLLDFAQAEEVRIESGCCAGSCGSCIVAIKSGTVEYLKKPDADPEAGTCLTCICKPSSDLVLDA